MYFSRMGILAVFVLGRLEASLGADGAFLHRTLGVRAPEVRTFRDSKTLGISPQHRKLKLHSFQAFKSPRERL